MKAPTWPFCHWPNCNEPAFALVMNLPTMYCAAHREIVINQSKAARRER